MMNHRLIVGMMGCILLVCVIGLQAGVITIDGSDRDWMSPDTTNDDAREAWYQNAWHDDVDIEFNYYEWDYETGNGYCAFAFRTYDTMPPDSCGDYTEILINVDEDSGTGGARHGRSGFEYALYYDLSASSPNVILYEYNSGSWADVGGADVDALRLPTTDFVEFHISATDIGFPSKFQWAAYYDNDDSPPDDWCPDDTDQPGFTPEPTTIVLLGLGLLGGRMWWRRRRD